jgi:hypothetical protein
MEFDLRALAYSKYFTTWATSPALELISYTEYFLQVYWGSFQQLFPWTGFHPINYNICMFFIKSNLKKFEAEEESNMDKITS